MDATIIIPSLLKQPSLLENCLDSVCKSTTQFTYEVVVILNISDLEFSTHRNRFERFDTKCRWICLGSNMGFTGAVNAGIASSKGNRIILLNDDTEVQEEWVENIVQTQIDSQADMIASVIYLSDKKQLDSRGFTFFWRGKAEALHTQAKFYSQKDHWLANTDLLPGVTAQFWQEPFGPDAAACLYTKKLFNTIGTFDEKFFAYLEDVDVALRARKAGMSCVVADNAVVYHHKHATSSSLGLFKVTQDLRNWWRIVLYRYTLKIWLRFCSQIIIERVRNISGVLKTISRHRK